MWNRKQIHSFSTANGSLKICFEEQGPVNVDTHQQDLKDLFPDIDIDHYKFHFRIALYFSLLTDPCDMSSLKN